MHDQIEFTALAFYRVRGHPAFSGPSPIAANDREELAQKLCGKVIRVVGYDWRIDAIECGGARIKVGRPIGLMVTALRAGANRPANPGST